MKKVLGAIAITAAMFATTAAFAGDNAIGSSQKRMHAEWDKSRAQGGWGRDTAGASQAADTRKNFTGVSSIFGPSGTHYGNGAWSGNYYTFRERDHAER